MDAADRRGRLSTMIPSAMTVDRASHPDDRANVIIGLASR